MHTSIKIRISKREKDFWKKVAQISGEDLYQFVGNAIRLRVQSLDAKRTSAWSYLPGSVRSGAPSATNRNARRAMRMGRGKADYGENYDFDSSERLPLLYWHKLPWLRANILRGRPNESIIFPLLRDVRRPT